MKTKTNSFTKFITFCVLALFLITNMIFFTSCDNGNSPNDNTNEEQNNTQNTDYCEICDGLQTENCGIKHKCDDENCVEYSDNRIYKNGHTHDYCERTDCDGSTHMGADHPTGPTYSDWFKKITIGGEGSPYKTCYIDVSEFNEENRDKTQIDQFNLRRNEFQKYINDLGFTDIQLMKFGENNDQANNITTVDNNFDTSAYRIKDYCDDIIKDITNNINISDNKTLNQQQFVNYYKAIREKAYFDAYSDNADSKIKESYTNAKDNIKNAWTNIHVHHNTTAPIPSIYQKVTDENGKVVSEVISPEVITQLNLMLESTVPNMGKDIKFLQNVMNLSWVIDSMDAIHDYTKNKPCDYTNNTIEDIISNEITL